MTWTINDGSNQPGSGPANTDDGPDLLGDIWSGAKKALHALEDVPVIGPVVGLGERAGESWLDTIVGGKLGSALGQKAGELLSDGEINFTNCFPRHRDHGHGGGGGRGGAGGGDGAPEQERERVRPGQNPTVGSDDRPKPETITMSNGDTITIGGPGRVQMTDKNGDPITKVKRTNEGMMDAGIFYEMSNGASYHTRGTWNHNESIRYPNGDSVAFTDDGRILSTNIGGVEKKYS